MSLHEGMALSTHLVAQGPGQGLWCSGVAWSLKNLSCGGSKLPHSSRVVSTPGEVIKREPAGKRNILLVMSQL